MYAGVPSAADLSPSPSGSSAVGSRSRCAMLKSTSFTSPRRERITLAGLTSRWMTPRAWACARPRATSWPMAATISGRSLGFLAMTSARVWPPMYSRTRYICVSVFTKSKHRTMLGCDSPARTRASRSSCAAKLEVGRMVGLSALIAILRPSGSCVAL